MDGALKGFVRLARPANLPTAAADILAGISIAGIFGSGDISLLYSSGLVYKILLLVFSSICLYAGGVVFNDFFDRTLDAVERPERPIPSKMVSGKNAALFGAVLLCIGVLASFIVGMLCGFLSIFLVLAILLYDAVAKHHVFFGPLNMGVCRGLNLLLGMGILGTLSHWEIASIPILYIGAITLVSRGEVHGSNKRNIGIAAVLYTLVICSILGLGILNSNNFVTVLPFVVVFAFLIYVPLQKAYRENTPANVKGAVKAGVVSLIMMDAALAVVFAPWWVALGIVSLLPLSKFLSKRFAVT